MNGRQRGFDSGALGLKPRRQLEPLAEPLHRFVSRKPRAVRRDFEQDAAGFAIVDGVEIDAAHDGQNVIPQPADLSQPLALLSVVGSPKGNMVYGADRYPSFVTGRRADHVNGSARFG